MPWGLRGWWRWWASRRCFTQVLNTDRNGPFKGSHSKWGRSASAVQLAFRQPRSHSYSALSFQYRLPLLTSLIAFSQSLGYVFDESIKTLCIAKQAKPESHQGSGVLHCIFSALCCIFLSGLSLMPSDIPRSEYLTVNNIEEVHTDNSCLISRRWLHLDHVHCLLHTNMLQGMNNILMILLFSQICQ